MYVPLGTAERNTKEAGRSVEKWTTEKSQKKQGIYKCCTPHSLGTPLSQGQSSKLPFSCLTMAHAPPPSKATGWQCICGCKMTNVRTMNKHMKKHAQQLNIKTTHLASLTAVFHPKKQPRPLSSRYIFPILFSFFPI